MDSCPSHFHESGFLFEFECIRTEPRCSAQVIVDCLREGGLKRRWTKQEDEKLCLAVKAVGTHDWKRIAEQHLAGHGRSDVQCLHRWQKVLRAGLVKGAFTEEEDKIIIACMNEGGAISAF